MKKIYVAGKLNDRAVGYIKNMHYMIKIANSIRENGFSVYIPCLDFLSGLVDGSMEYKDYFDNNMPWLLCADAIFVCLGYETSMGTREEIQRAQQNSIPIYYDLQKLVEDMTE